MKKTLKSVNELIKWLIYWYPLRLFVQRIPLRINYKLANIIAPLYYVLSKENRRRIEDGLSMMYRGNISKRRKREISKETFRNMVLLFMEFLLYPKLTKVICENILKIDGLENLENALKFGRGVVLLHGHFGNAHLIMPAIGYKGYKLNQLASRRPPSTKISGPLGWIYNRIRNNSYKTLLRYKETLPVSFIYTDSPIREVFRSLRKNEIIAIGMDGREGSRWVEIDFLGGKAIFYTGTMKLLLKINPVVLPVFHIRNKDDTHTIIIEKPMSFEFTGDKELNTLRNIKKFLNILESYIYRYPDHYANVFCLRKPFFISPWRNV